MNVRKHNVLDHLLKLVSTLIVIIDLDAQPISHRSNRAKLKVSLIKLHFSCSICCFFFSNLSKMNKDKPAPGPVSTRRQSMGIWTNSAFCYFFSFFFKLLVLNFKYFVFFCFFQSMLQALTKRKSERTKKEYPPHPMGRRSQSVPITSDSSKKATPKKSTK